MKKMVCLVLLLVVTLSVSMSSFAAWGPVGMYNVYNFMDIAHLNGLDGSPVVQVNGSFGQWELHAAQGDFSMYKDLATGKFLTARGSSVTLENYCPSYPQYWVSRKCSYYPSNHSGVTAEAYAILSSTNGKALTVPQSSKHCGILTLENFSASNKRQLFQFR